MKPLGMVFVFEAGVASS